MKDDKTDSTRPKTDEDKLKLRLQVVLHLIAAHKVRNLVNAGRGKLTWFAGNEHQKFLQLFVGMKPARHESAVAYAIRRGDLARSIAYWRSMEREALEDLRKLRMERDSILWKLHVMRLRQEKRDNDFVIKPGNKKKPQTKKQLPKTKQTGKKPATYRNPTPADFAEDTMNGDDYDAGCR